MVDYSVVTPLNGKQKKVSLSFNDVSLTDQSAKEECDIGFIIEHFVKTGQSPDRPNMTYLDCTTVQSYEDAMALVAETKTQFELLPSSERDKFKTISGWLDYVNNPDNLADCVNKGYIADTPAVREVLSPEPVVKEKEEIKVSESLKKEVNANS